MTAAHSESRTPSQFQQAIGAVVLVGLTLVTTPGSDSPISAEIVAKVARLARLDITDEQVAHFTEQLGKVMDHFHDIDNLNLDDVEPMAQPYPLVNVMRDDVETPTLNREEVLAVAPAAEDSRFRVPPIIGLDG